MSPSLLGVSFMKKNSSDQVPTTMNFCDVRHDLPTVDVGRCSLLLSNTFASGTEGRREVCPCPTIMLIDGMCPQVRALIENLTSAVPQRSTCHVRTMHATEILPLQSVTVRTGTTSPSGIGRQTFSCNGVQRAV